MYRRLRRSHCYNAFSPQNCPFPWGSRPPQNTWFPEPTRVHNPDDITIGSLVFAMLTLLSNKDRHAASIAVSYALHSDVA